MKLKRPLILIGALLIGWGVIAQEREAELAQVLLKKLNDVRIKQQLEALEQDEVLAAAAFDQAQYIVGLGKVTNVQENAKKESLEDRVKYYEGLHGSLGENAAKISRGSKEQVKVNGPRVMIDSDDLLMDAVIASWLKEGESSKENLLDPNFYKVGIGIIEAENREVTIVAVFGSEPYLVPNGNKLYLKNHGIRPYDETGCKEFLADYPTLPQLLSDVVKVEGNEVRLQYHSSRFIENILSNASDELALDIIDRNQFSCEGGNRLFPGSIATGYLMKPVKRGYINARNSLDSIGELSAVLGKLPNFYDPKTSEINLIVVKNGIHCATIPFNQFEVKNKRNFDVPFLLAGETDSTTYTWRDSVELTYSLLSTWKEEVEKDKRALESFSFDISSEELKVRLSPIHAEKIPLDSSWNDANITIVWDSLDAFTKGTYYQLDLAELDQSGKVDFLNEAIKEDKELRNYLNRLNTLSLKLKGRGNLYEDLSVSESLELYQFFLNNNKIEPALFLQAKLLEKVRKGEIKADELPKADPSQKENTLAVINNQIVLEHVMGAKKYDGNPIYLAFFELYLINKSEVEVNFNYHTAKLRYWANNYSKIKNFPSWMSEFKKIPSANIPVEKYARAMLNYHLLAVDYYFDTEKFDQRKKSFTEIMKWQAKAGLNDLEILQLAKTLCFQDQFDQAIELLKPSVQKEKPLKAALFYYLQITRYTNEAQQVEFFQKAKTLYPKSFCDLFSNKRMGIQALKNPVVKEIYCENCQ